MIQITAPHFCAGIDLADGFVIEAALIVKYMHDWSQTKVLNYCRVKGWEVFEV